MKRHRFRFTFFLSICLLIPLIAGAAPVDIPDANLRAAIEKELNKQAGDPPITAADMVTLTSLSASDSNISDLTGLEHATKLTSLDLEGNSISDISVLAELTTLTSLDLDDNSILDISALAELTTLTSLKLNFNSVSDISAVSGLTNLERLELRNNSISDISDLSGLTNLTRLNLSENGFSDVSALVPVLSRLTNLTSLILSGNGISDVSALSEFTNLTSLELSANRISDISVLAGFTNLNSIDLDYNSISDISPLVENTGLGSGDTIRIIDNPLSYPSLYTHIPTLEEREVRIEFTPRTPTALWKISGTITESDNVLVVEVRDSDGEPFSGVPVTFTVTSGGGTLNLTSTTTNENGRAESTLTPGADGEPNTATASVEGISETVTFSDVPEPTVDIPDLNLRAKIEQVLGKASDSPITDADLANLTNLVASDTNINDLTGLERATNLTELDLSFNSISNISALSGLTNLTRLNLRDNKVSDISALSSLTNLTWLNLSGNGFSDVSALVPVLSGLTNLTSLHLWENGISDVSALAGLTHLTSLSLLANRISDISVLSSLTNLNSINLDSNLISDISPLVENTGLGSGDRIRIIDNPLSYPSLHTHIPTLEERGVRIEFTPRTPTTLLRISSTITESDNVLVVEVRDSKEKPFAGVPVTFTVTSGGGTLNVKSTTTNENGRAESTLTLGADGEPNTATASVEGISEPATFTDVPEPTVDIPDSNLRAAIETALGKQVGDPITTADMANLSSLVASRANISDLTGLEHATNLTTLNLEDNSISNISPVAGLTKLTSLRLEDNMISNILPVSGLTNLTYLWLRRNMISDISPVADLTNLTGLWLRRNMISDISPVSGLTNLTSLGLRDNSISDISPLVANTGLGSGDRIDILGNPLSYPSLHTHIPTLEERGVRIEFTPRTPTTLLKISGTITESDNVLVVEVRDSKEKPFAGVPVTFTVTSGGGTLSVTSTTTNENGRAESTLTLGADGEPNTASASVEGIAEPVTFTNVPEPTVDIPDPNLRTVIEMALNKQAGDPITATDLATLTEIDAIEANISDLTGLEHATKLTQLTLHNNSVLDISALSGLTNLTSIELGNSSVSDISALSGLTKLIYLDFHNNSVSDISALSGLTKLIRLLLSGNSISDLSPLVANTGLGSGDTIDVLDNPLSYSSFYTHIPTLQSRGVEIQFDDTPPAAIEFDLSVPSGISLIHVPLKVTAVDGAAKTIESVGDLYDALGGSANVSILITHDPKTQRWIGYLGDRDKGKPANDKALTDGLGIIASMKAPASIRLSGSPLGTNGSSSITLYPGTNLVGVPLKDSRIAKVSDLLNLDGIRGNVSVIIVSDKGKFKVVVRPDDDGNIQISGGQSFILNTREMATVDITGDGWANAPGTTAAPPMALTGIQVEASTPILAVTGSIVSPVDGASLPRPLGADFIVSPVDGASLPRPLGSGFRVTIKNLSTGKADTAVTDDDGVGYQLTFVDIESGRVAQIGDTLEITAQSHNPLVRVQPVWYVVTAEDVKRGHIQLGTLVAYEIPAKTELLLNYPNPFNPETWIPYRLAEDANVTLTIYDLSGGVVRRLNVGHQVAAAYERRDKAIYWDGRTEFGERVASGIYFYHLSAGDYSAARKMVILK